MTHEYVLLLVLRQHSYILQLAPRPGGHACRYKKQTVPPSSQEDNLLLRD